MACARWLVSRGTRIFFFRRQIVVVVVGFVIFLFLKISFSTNHDTWENFISRYHAWEPINFLIGELNNAQAFSIIPGPVLTLENAFVPNGIEFWIVLVMNFSKFKIYLIFSFGSSGIRSGSLVWVGAERLHKTAEHRSRFVVAFSGIHRSFLK